MRSHVGFHYKDIEYSNKCDSNKEKNFCFFVLVMKDGWKISMEASLEVVSNF